MHKEWGERKVLAQSLSIELGFIAKLHYIIEMNLNFSYKLEGLGGLSRLLAHEECMHFAYTDVILAE